MLAAALAAGGCADPEPAGEPPFFVVSGPKGFRSFEVRDFGDEVIWAIEADSEAEVELSTLVYGRLPAGFRQTVPAGPEEPRLLVPGEILTTRSVSGRRLFVHQGFAQSARVWAVSDWRVELLEPEGAEPDRAEPGTGDGAASQ